MRTHRWQPTRLPRPWDSPGKNTGAGCHFLLQCMKVKSESEVAQLCLTSSNLMDCSPPGSSVHGSRKMVEMYPYAKHKHRHRDRQQMYGHQGVGGNREVGWTGRLRLTYLYYYAYNRWVIRTYSIAQWTLLGALWWQRGNICIHITDSLCYMEETKTSL